MTIPRSWRSGHAGRSRPGALPQGRGGEAKAGQTICRSASTRNSGLTSQMTRLRPLCLAA